MTAETPTPRRWWARRVAGKGGPWHLKTGGDSRTVCGRRLTGMLDYEHYAELPSGFGPGTICPECAATITQPKETP